MGRIAQAAKSTHVPSIWMSHTMEKYRGIRQSAIDGLRELGRRAREAREHLAVEQSADLLRVVLHHRVAERDLAVAGHGYAAVAPHRQDRRAMHGIGRRHG